MLSMGSALSAHHLPAVPSIWHGSSTNGCTNFKALVSQCNTFIDNSQDATPRILLYDDEGSAIPQISFDITIEGQMVSEGEEPMQYCCGTFSFDHYFSHQREMCRLRNIIKTSLQESRYSEYLLQKHKCSHCLSPGRHGSVNIQTYFDKRAYADTLQLPFVDSGAKCTCEQICCLSKETSQRSGVCDVHMIYLNGVTCTKNSVRWEIQFSDGQGCDGYNNPGFFVHGGTPSGDSDSFDIVFDRLADTECQLNMDIDFEMDVARLHPSRTSSLSQFSWMLDDGDGEESDEYESSTDDDNDADDCIDSEESVNDSDDLFDEISCSFSVTCPLLSSACEDSSQVSSQTPKHSASPSAVFSGIVVKSVANEFLCPQVQVTVESNYHQCCSPTPNYKDDSHVCNNDNGGIAKRKVAFAAAESLATVHYMVAWKHAYRESRKTYWENFVSDRAHFRRRLQNLSEILEPVLQKKLAQIETSEILEV